MLIVGAALLPGAPAQAADRYVGKTTQDRRITISVGSDGLVTRVVTLYVAGCRDPDSDYRTKVAWSLPFDERTPERFRESGRVVVGNRDGYATTVTSEIVGARSADGRRWTGTLTAKLVVRKRGHYVDTCRTPTIRFSATRVS